MKELSGLTWAKAKRIGKPFFQKRIEDLKNYLQKRKDENPYVSPRTQNYKPI